MGHKKKIHPNTHTHTYYIYYINFYKRKDRHTHAIIYIQR